jgi:myo-inositol 2-dehydrogenase / D-chiro-inositol 1-dehydrogenase
MITRRSLLASTTVATVSAATHAFASSRENTIRIGLIGCGGRGTGACNQAMNAGSSVRLTALLDPLEGKAQAALQTLKQYHDGQIDVPPDGVFTDFNDYTKVFERSDVVLIGTPPGPRPKLFQEAVKAGKHVFMEKPVATDMPGVRQVLAAAQEAKAKNLNVCVGLQRRYQPSYQGLIQRLHEGEIGELLFGRVYWNGTSRPGAVREAGESEMHYQIRNWYFFTWMSGDHILEQHCHNLDVAHWALNGLTPVRAIGQGGRQVRNKPENGTIFDHHTVEFEYENGFRLLSQCSQMGGKCARNVSEHFHGTRGVANLGDGGRFMINGQYPGGKRQRIKEDGHQLEHDVLFENIRTGKVRNDGEYAAHSTMLGIMGRMATYTGQVITWDQLMNSQETLVPETIDWQTDPPVKPDKDGHYPVALPGVTLPI